MPASRAQGIVSPLAAIIAERIRSHGPITFAEYMDTCLYHPEFGYYTKREQQPRRDYFTSVDTGPLFAKLLARQFHEMWMHLGQPPNFALVEVGAGYGALAAQILEFAAREFPQFYAAVHYVAVERSVTRRDLMARTESLRSHLDSRKFGTASEIPAETACGCIFSNELFDAMPVYRVVCEGTELRELYVTLGPNGLGECSGALSLDALREYFSDQAIALEEGQQAEAGLHACRWIEDAGRTLQRGFVLTIDYGHEAGELYDQRHMRGTLLAYHRHRAGEDFFRAPGEQDLTAHVNFTALGRWGKRAGLARTGLTSQSTFLMALARRSDFAELQSERMSEGERSRARLLFKTLIYPEGMGETFQVFIQHKNVESPRLTGLEPL
ncbi:MAG: SAM-dependent methyltransferase [Candidatus Acidiferrales bacterium]